MSAAEVLTDSKESAVPKICRVFSKDALAELRSKLEEPLRTVGKMGMV